MRVSSIMMAIYIWTQKDDLVSDIKYRSIPYMDGDVKMLLSSIYKCMPSSIMALTHTGTEK